MGIIKTLKQQGSELSKYDGKTPPDNNIERLNTRLKLQGSELSRYDGRTPLILPQFNDPSDDSVASNLSAYKGRTPQPSLLTTNQSPLLYPYSITGEAREQVQFEYGFYPNGATAVLPLPTLLGVNIFDTPLSYYYDGTDGYYGKTVGVGPNPSRQTLSDGTLENRLTIAYIAKIAHRDLGKSLGINPFGITTTVPPNILLQYNSPVSSPEEPSLEFVRIQNPTIQLKDLYDKGDEMFTQRYFNPNRVSPLPGQKFDSHKEPEWVYSPLKSIQSTGVTKVLARRVEFSLDTPGGRADKNIITTSGDNPPGLFRELFYSGISFFREKSNIPFISDYRSASGSIVTSGYLVPSIVDPANINWVYNPLLYPGPNALGLTIKDEDSFPEATDPLLRFYSSIVQYASKVSDDDINEYTNILNTTYGENLGESFSDNFLKPNQNNTNIQAFDRTRGFSPIKPGTGLSNLNPYYTLRINATNNLATYNNGSQVEISSQGYATIPMPDPYPNIQGFNRVFTYETSDSVFRKSKTRQTNEFISFDSLNETGILEGSADKGVYESDDVEKNLSPIQNWKNKDLIKFFFEINNNDAQTNTANWFLFFRAYINNFGDNFNSTWQEYKYIGRGENFYKYSGFSREISLDFTIYAHSRVEMIPLYEKLNYLVSSLAPDYSKMGYMRGNFVNLTIGDYINNTPGIIKSIQLKPSLEAGWDINRYAIERTVVEGEERIVGDAFKIGRILDPNIVDYDGENYFVGQLPRLIDVTMTFTPIHSFTPRFKENFIRNKDYTIPPQESFTQEEIDRLNKAAEGDTLDIIGPSPSFNDI